MRIILRWFGLFFIISIITTYSCNTLQDSKLIYYVDPFIGTGGHGHTYPGAAWPFGMVQLSPDTRLDGWDGCGGYHYSDNVIYGFSHTHLSGTGVSDYGDILLMPTTGKINFNNGSDGDIVNGYGSEFDHAHESASPGYYSVMLNDYNIKAELTVTPRTGMHRYTFPENEQSNIILDLVHRDIVILSEIRIVNDSTIEGFRRSNAWARDQHVYFVAEFSKPFRDFGIAVNDKIISGIRQQQGKHIKAYFSFRTKINEQIIVKVGISAVSIDGARKNLAAENPGFDFEMVRNHARKAWEDELGKIKVEGDNKNDKTVFYTSLYHAFLNPNLFMDHDGRYRGTDLQVHKAEDFVNYTVFSLWDTYRAEHPLLTIIDQERTNDFINTMLAQYKNGGQLPVWELSANYTGCMIGYHSVPVIVDAFLKDINNFDPDLAMEAMQHSAEQDHLGLEYYRSMGYIPAEMESESVSKTLEYAYDDWCIAQMAKKLGKNEVYTDYIQRAQYYKNLFDPSTGFMRAKMNGFWFDPFNPREVNFNYTEANSWQYSFYVPQDVDGLMNLMGGEIAFEQKLDELFTTTSETTGRDQADITGLIGQYAHGNEPSHHMAYLYNYVGKPWKTQEMVRKIMREFYYASPDGLCGNEDCGQMSAWYVMSAMGFYPVCPGQDFYVIGSPKFEKIIINLESGNKFEIIAENNSEKNIYIQSANLNNTPLSTSYLYHEDIMKGGKLTLSMGPNPNKQWAKHNNSRPKSAITDHQIVPVPFISRGTHTFIDSAIVELGCVLKEANINYTFSHEPPYQYSDIYTSPIVINKTSDLRAFSLVEGLHRSFEISAELFKIPELIKIKLNTEYSSQYSAGGDLALIDHLTGGKDFRTGTWQGYHGVDLDVEIDLNESRYINNVSINFLQDINAWIFMPFEVQFYISGDDKNFHHVRTIFNHLSHKDEGTYISSFLSDIQSNARFIKITGKNIGTCPEWHKGAGGKAWIFADEINFQY